MQTNSGASVFSQETNLPNSTERIMTMVGDAEALQIAAYTLASMIGNEHENSQGPPQILFDPAYQQQPMMHPPNNMGGYYSSDVRGDYRGDSRNKGGRSDYPPPSYRQNNFQQGGPSGDSHHRQNAAGNLNPEQQSAISYYYSQMQIMTAQYPQMASQYQQQYQQYYSQMVAAAASNPSSQGNGGGGMMPVIGTGPKVVDEVMVPNQYVGCVIGKGGSFIKDIRMMTQSEVKISDPVEGEPGRVALITGTVEGNKVAFEINSRLLSTLSIKR